MGDLGSNLRKPVFRTKVLSHYITQSTKSSHRNVGATDSQREQAQPAERSQGEEGGILGPFLCDPGFPAIRLLHLEIMASPQIEGLKKQNLTHYPKSFSKCLFPVNVIIPSHHQHQTLMDNLLVLENCIKDSKMLPCPA